MDYDKLIERLRQNGVAYMRAYGRYSSICNEVITALSTLQAESEKLRAELECARESLDFARTKDAEIVRLGTELEQVERMRGEWMFKPFYKGTSRGAIECQKCKSAFEGSVGFNFCPHCGAPMTDEAVEMVMERMEKLYETI